MTDLEITKLCAEAMGIDFSKGYATIHCEECDEYGISYDPLHDDAQAMALVRKFEISIAWSWTGQMGCMSKWEAQQDEEKRHDNIECSYKDLNRAICECVAKVQKAKS